MSDVASIDAALAHATATLSRLGVRYALVGGLAVSVRSDVRFTRNVDLAVVVGDNEEAEQVFHQLRAEGYAPIATVEHEKHERLATARLRSPSGWWSIWSLPRAVSSQKSLGRPPRLTTPE